MVKIKLTKKEIALSSLLFIVCHIVLLAVLFAAVAINTEGQFIEFFRKEYVNIITVAVAVSIMSMIIYFYFFIENKSLLVSYKKITEVYFLMCLSFLVCDVISKYVAPTARPLLFFPLLACMFFRRKEAIFLNTINLLITFVFNRYVNSVDVSGGSVQMIESFAGLLTSFCCGVAAIFIMKNIKTRLGCVLCVITLVVPVIAVNLVMQVPSVEGDWFTVIEIIIYSVFDCIMSVLLFMCVLPIVEGLFSELTVFRLRELTSDNAKLIKHMKQHALGTYNHSVVVAQLVEACAGAIGEDSELARACAYYHDVGKLKNPEMFAENQTEYDMHKELTPELSVDIIRSHAKDGAQLIRKNRLPEIFADIAVQHHGTMPIKYFYAKALRMSDGELNVNNYSYSGPTPTTKIAAIVMIADASEAAARSLADRSPEKVAALVGNIVEERMNQEQFYDCDVTMRELTIITQTIINQLTGVYHSRVKYPKLVLQRK